VPVGSSGLFLISIEAGGGFRFLPSTRDHASIAHENAYATLGRVRTALRQLPPPLFSQPTKVLACRTLPTDGCFAHLFGYGFCQKLRLPNYLKTGPKRLFFRVCKAIAIATADFNSSSPGGL
jgi:hypothetical protein